MTRFGPWSVEREPELCLVAIAATDGCLGFPPWFTIRHASEAVRYVVGALGIDKKIDLLSWNGSARMRVRIQSIEQNGFTYVHGFRSAVDSIAYGDVSQVKPAGMHWAAKAAIKAAIIYVGVGVGVGLIAALANGASN